MSVAVPHVVYRCWDADDRLVYIGCTSQGVASRLRQHRHQHPRVWEQTHHWTAEKYPDHETAHNAEMQAIYHEMPLLNVYHNYRRYPVVEETVVETPRSRKRESLIALGAAGAA